MTLSQRTIFFEEHKKLNAKIVEFGGWEMPIQYHDGILAEHISTRSYCGVFDVCHMGRLFFQGTDTVTFLQKVLTNNAMDLEVGESQYTLIQNTTGGALDDAYLYRIKTDEYLLVVNASNREKDVLHLAKHIEEFPEVRMTDKTNTIAMISLQGPMSERIIKKIIVAGELPKPKRNSLSFVQIEEGEVLLTRTGYTGEPICFELFMKNDIACNIWRLLIENGATPIGLGARDTLRLEAGLPLYGHELGNDQEGNEIPIFTSKLSRFGVSFSESKGEFVGKRALTQQLIARKKILKNNFSTENALKKTIVPLTMTGKGVAREGHRVFFKKKLIGYITSGTSVPYKLSYSDEQDNEVRRRSIALALVDSSVRIGDVFEVEIRKNKCKAMVVKAHINSQQPPYVEVILNK